MRQVLGAGALGRPRGMGWGGRQERRSGWGIHVNPWLIHVNVWQKPLQYCKVISLQLIKINEKKRITLVKHLTFLKETAICPLLIGSQLTVQFHLVIVTELAVNAHIILPCPLF